MTSVDPQNTNPAKHTKMQASCFKTFPFQIAMMLACCHNTGKHRWPGLVLAIIVKLGEIEPVHKGM
jgi:hypothetical protein